MESHNYDWSSKEIETVNLGINSDRDGSHNYDWSSKEIET